MRLQNIYIRAELNKFAVSDRKYKVNKMDRKHVINEQR